MPAKKKSAKKKSTQKGNIDEQRNPELEALIVPDQDSVEAYSVYGDWLQSQGDPRGDLIGLMIAVESNPALQPEVASAIEHYEAVALAQATPYVELFW